MLSARQGSRVFRYLVSVGSACLTGALGVAGYTVYQLNRAHPQDRVERFSPWEAQVDYEHISFTSTANVKLRGWWLSRPESPHVIVCLGGYRSSKSDLLGIGASLWRAGNNVVLFDYRGCGTSDAGPQSLGHHELHDAQAALRYVRARLPDARIGLLGHSMGGALAILVASADPSIRAVVVDSPFATLRDIVGDAYRRRHLPPQPLLALTDLLTRHAYGYSFQTVRPLDVVARIAPRPLLIIHSACDDVISIAHSQRLFAAASQPKMFWQLDDAAHCGGYLADRPGYAARMVAFFNEAFAPTPLARTLSGDEMLCWDTQRLLAAVRTSEQHPDAA